MKKIGVIVNTKRMGTAGILEELRLLAGTYDLELYAESPAMAAPLGAACIPVSEFGSTVDIALALGGDGTVLYTARAVHGHHVPIMGINLGSLGFLTSVGDTEMPAAIKALAEGSCRVSRRDVAECRIYQDEERIGAQCALNDAVLGWGASSRIVTLDLMIDGEDIGSFMCDGMIVSTPTGSTGHSLSSGGPILHPEVGGFGVNVICPHTLSSRPLVVPKSSAISIRVAQAPKELILSIDGQDNFRVAQGGRIDIQRSPDQIEFLQLEGHSYFSVLSKKLHWRGSSL